MSQDPKDVTGRFVRATVAVALLYCEEEELLASGIPSPASVNRAMNLMKVAFMFAGEPSCFEEHPMDGVRVGRELAIACGMSHQVVDGKLVELVGEMFGGPAPSSN